MENTFEEYSVKTRCSKQKQFSVSNSHGSFEFYNYIAHNKLNKFKQDRGRTMRTIRNVGNYIRDYVAAGKEIVLPYGLGSLILKASDSAVLSQDGEVKIRSSVNWYETLKLWFEDDEARENKVLVKYTSPKTFIPMWEKSKLYKNVSFYKFYFNRILKAKIKDNIKNGVVCDAPLRYRSDGR